MPVAKISEIEWIASEDFTGSAFMRKFSNRKSSQRNPLNLAKYQESVGAKDKFGGKWSRLAINQEQVVVPKECAQKLGEAAVLSPLDPEID
ncbi:hypothetical protein WA026_008803 [Henosepilachna vigintioctopunctata]|uniref:Uncharacterized protein n=1 Tax=Henosepilachna vigintioctopunctata TaxID=420089 RepID=A0AAW1V2S3_9CUCU